MKDRIAALLESAGKTHNLALAVVSLVFAWIALHNRYDVGRVTAVGTVLGLLYGANAVGSVGTAWANRGNGNGAAHPATDVPPK